MEQIHVAFYILTSFFTAPQATVIVANTSVTVNIVEKTITITQEDLHALIIKQEDTLQAALFWHDVIAQDTTALQWKDHLKPFNKKSIITTAGSLHTTISLHYSSHDDLRTLGIWFNDRTGRYSINHIPSLGINTRDGRLEGNYWYFDTKNSFNFTIEPLDNLPVKSKTNLVPITKIIRNKK